MKFIQESQVEKELKYSKETTKEYLLNKLDEDDHQLFFDKAYTLIKKIHDESEIDGFFTYTTKSGEVKDAAYLREVYDFISKLGTVKIASMLKTLYCSVWKANGEPVDIQVLAGQLLPYFKEMSTTHRKFIAVQHILELFDSMNITFRHCLKWDRVQFSLNPIEDISVLFSLNNRGTTLPLVELPKTVHNNRDCGYHHIKRPLLLGSGVSYHDFPLNYRHINRVNRIQFEYETRLFDLCEPKFNWNPKPKKKTGVMETEEDILIRYESFKRLVDNLPERLNKLGTNQFYYCHAYDTRGRMYPKAYEFNYQGIKAIKAVINFAQKEIIEPQFGEQSC